MVEVRLRGVGLAVAALSVQPSTVDFGGVRLGTSTSRKITVVTWSQPVVARISGSDPDFVITKSGCTGPGGVCEVEVTFAPAAAGQRSGQLVVTAPACGGATASAALSGTGLP
jgi:hypothetical protein